MENANDLLTAYDALLVSVGMNIPIDLNTRLWDFRRRLLREVKGEVAMQADVAAVVKGVAADRGTPPPDVSVSYKDAPNGGFTAVRRDSLDQFRKLIGDLPASDKVSIVLPAESAWIQEYRTVISESGPDSVAAANYLAARADVPAFVSAADGIRRSHEGLAKYKAACAADARSDARSAFVGKVGRLAWGLIKFASIASAAGYVGRLAWADLAARYFG